MRQIQISYQLKVGTVFLLATAIIFLRSHYAFLYPVLACEDGNAMLAYFFNNPAPSSIFRIYAGYVSVLPNLIGYIGVLFPITVVPFVLAYYPLLLAGFSHTIFAFRRYRLILADDHLRMLVCLLVALLPIGDILLFSNTAYSIWNLLWILILLTYAPLSTAKRENILQLGLLALLITSHPLSFLIAPICIYNLITRRTWSDWLVNGSVLLLILLYLGTAIVTTNEQFNHPLLAVQEAFGLVINRVIVEAPIGYRERMSLYKAGYHILLNSIGLTMLGLMGFFYLRAAKRLSFQRHIQIGFVCYLTGALTLITVLSRSTSSPSLWGPWELRYFFIQQKLFWLLLIVSGALYVKSLRSPTKQFIYTAVFGCYLIFLNAYNLRQFQTSPVEGRQLATFLQTIEKARKENAAKKRSQPVEFTLARSCFDIHIWVQ